MYATGETSAKKLAKLKLFQKPKSFSAKTVFINLEKALRVINKFRFRKFAFNKYRNWII